MKSGFQSDNSKFDEMPDSGAHDRFQSKRKAYNSLILPAMACALLLYALIWLSAPLNAWLVGALDASVDYIDNYLASEDKARMYEVFRKTLDSEKADVGVIYYSLAGARLLTGLDTGLIEDNPVQHQSLCRKIGESTEWNNPRALHHAIGAISELPDGCGDLREFAVARLKRMLSSLTSSGGRKKPHEIFQMMSSAERLKVEGRAARVELLR